jgi:hypothetical protein
MLLASLHLAWQEVEKGLLQSALFENWHCDVQH